MGRYWVRGEAQRPAAEACVSGRKRVSAHLVASVLEEVSPGLEVIRFAAPWRPARVTHRSGVRKNGVPKPATVA